MQKLAAAVTLALLVALGGIAAADGPEDETPQPPRKHEILRERPSGFWTSNRPATHGAYRWRMLAVGGVFLAGTVFVVFRLVRRANAERAGRDGRGV